MAVPGSIVMKYQDAGAVADFQRQSRAVTAKISGGAAMPLPFAPALTAAQG